MMAEPRVIPGLASYLDLCLVCTYDRALDMLEHSPQLQLIIAYYGPTADMATSRRK